MDIKTDFDLKKYNTFGVQAKAALCSVITRLEDLQAVIIKNKERYESVIRRQFYRRG